MTEIEQQRKIRHRLVSDTNPLIGRCSDAGTQRFDVHAVRTPERSTPASPPLSPKRCGSATESGN